MDNNRCNHEDDIMPSQDFQGEVQRDVKFENGEATYVKIKEEEIPIVVSDCSIDQGRQQRTRANSAVLREYEEGPPAKKRTSLTRRPGSSGRQHRLKDTEMAPHITSTVPGLKEPCEAPWGVPGTVGLEQGTSGAEDQANPADTDQGIGVVFPADGSSNRNTPERCLRPFYSHDYTEENHNIPQDYQGEHLSDFNIVIKEEIKEGRTIKEEEISTDIGTGSWRQREKGVTKMDLEKLASAMQLHPNLFDASHPLHYNKYKRDESWESICRALVPNWESMCKLEKIEKDRELHVKWRSLKDRFRKDLQAVTSAPSGCAPKKIHTHPLFKQLMFLKPSMELRGTSGKDESTNASGSVEDDAMIASEGEAQSVSGLSTDDPPTSTVEAEVPSPLVPAPRPPPVRPQRKNKKRTVDTDVHTAALVNIIDGLKAQLQSYIEKQRVTASPSKDDDEASLFCKSLIGNVRSVAPERLLNLKISMMNLIHHHLSAPYPPPTYPLYTAPSHPSYGPHFYTHNMSQQN
ncbi:uncharacterized protein LOC142159887 isoform X1 [Mixophyes fleayi]|uniref:uncharacterized protein LOC142159887 isoform X1 n=1 Tax=Mixophyes fleayi TaxID=3061075 RepID=UPI003F4DA48F